jgi:anti-sigma regulatory factor (Ser/Thr protein kinase)
VDVAVVGNAVLTDDGARLPPTLPSPVADDPGLLATLLDAAPLGFAYYDRDLRYRHVNRRLARGHGLAQDAHLGRTPWDVAPETAAAVEDHLRAVIASGESRLGVEMAGVNPDDGSPGRWSTSWYPVRAGHSGPVVGVALLVVEVSGASAGADALREMALTLQRSLLPALTPSSEELEVAVRYNPGVADTEVGGDWYDVIPLGAGRMAVVIGDVMGRGVRAAAVMGQLRTAVRTCARLDLQPVEVVELLDGLVSDLGDDFQIATCLYGVFDPHARELLMSSAGHIAPVVRTASGDVHPLDLAVSAPLGVADPPRHSRVRLLPGTVLALFTDGLVEVRGSDIDTGIEALCRVIAGGPDKLEELADAVLHRLTVDDADDDVALLLLRVPADVDSRSRTVVLDVPRERALLADLRALAQASMREWALLDEVVDTATLVTSELVTNALVHGKGPVELRIRLTRDWLVLEAADEGHHMPRRRRAGIDEEGGRGLHLVAALCDRWGARQTDEGKVVWAQLDLAATRRPARRLVPPFHRPNEA